MNEKNLKNLFLINLLLNEINILKELDIIRYFGRFNYNAPPNAQQGLDPVRIGPIKIY